MIARLLGRLGQSALVLLVVSLVSFMVFRYLGDPTVSLLGEDASVQEREALLAELGFDQPVLMQYGSYLQQVLAGNFGISYRYKQPVIQVIAERLPATAELSLMAALFAVVGGQRHRCLPGLRFAELGRQHAGGDRCGARERGHLRRHAVLHG